MSFYSRILNFDTNSSFSEEGQVGSCREALSSAAGRGESWRGLCDSRDSWAGFKAARPGGDVGGGRGRAVVEELAPCRGGMCWQTPLAQASVGGPGRSGPGSSLETGLLGAAILEPPSHAGLCENLDLQIWFFLRFFFPVSFHSPLLTSLWAFSIFLSCSSLSSLPSLAIRSIFFFNISSNIFFFFLLGPFTGQLNHHGDKGIP